MDVKSIAVILALIASASVEASSNNLESYYQEHHAEAFAKYDECKAQMAELATTGNAKAIMDLANNHYCKAAEKAINLATEEK